MVMYMAHYYQIMVQICVTSTKVNMAAIFKPDNDSGTMCIHARRVT